MDCYHASPAAVDAATHLGALWDTDRAGQPRVPVALQLYRAQQPGWQQVPSSLTLHRCGAPSAACDQLLWQLGRAATPPTMVHACTARAHAGTHGCRPWPGGDRAVHACREMPCRPAAAQRLQQARTGVQALRWQQATPPAWLAWLSSQPGPFRAEPPGRRQCLQLPPAWPTRPSGRLMQSTILPGAVWRAASAAGPSRHLCRTGDGCCLQAPRGTHWLPLRWPALPWLRRCSALPGLRLAGLQHELLALAAHKARPQLAQLQQTRRIRLLRPCQAQHAPLQWRRLGSACRSLSTARLRQARLLQLLSSWRGTAMAAGLPVDRWLLPGKQTVLSITVTSAHTVCSAAQSRALTDTMHAMIGCVFAVCTMFKLTLAGFAGC